MTRKEAITILYAIKGDSLKDDDPDSRFIYDAVTIAIKALEQEPKTGHWITWKEAGNEIASETRFECSVCHDSAQTLCNGLDLLSPYCPNCGAKMVE